VLLASTSPLLTLSLVLVAGIVGGVLARRVHLPSVTGQILAGIALGQAGLFEHEDLRAQGPVLDFALGLMAVAVGNHLNLRKLRHAFKRLGLLLAAEVMITPLLVLLAVALAGAPWTVAILLAAVSISTAPATVLALVRETRSKGVFVSTLVAAVALDNLACIAVFEVAHTAVGMEFAPDGAPSFLRLLWAPIAVIGLAVALGAVVGVALVLFTRRTVRSDRLAAASIVAILLATGIAESIGGSALLACLALGVTLANLTPEREEIGHRVFDNFEYAIFAVFFTLAGCELRFQYLVPAGALALAAFLARLVGKIASAQAAMRLAGATDRVRRWLGPALVPQAGLAVGLALLAAEDPALLPIRDLLLAVVLTVVLGNEIVGPLLTRYALARSGDFGKDRARLIDFLHEEHIVTGLEARTKEEAIEKLTDHLLRTNRLKVDRETMLKSVLDREAHGSTCLGGGLAVPHGPLTDHDRIAGVMGISREGLRFDTPDGVPVHCMVLLATPAGHHDRHLEVLAAFARVIGTDPATRQQLYLAPTPARAYEVLHAEEASEDFNYFLEE
jgi:PTS system fructose-specific IIC component